MKKKILLKSLVIATPLMGVVSPLVSCTTSNGKELLHNNLKNDSVSNYCPIVVYPFGPHTIEADKPLPIPDPFSGEELKEQEIRLYCNNPSFVVKGIEKVVAFTIDGSEVELQKERDYSLETNQSNGYASLCFTEEYVNGNLVDQLPYFISVVPNNVSVDAYNVTFTSSQIESNLEKVSDIVNGFKQTITIKEEFRDYQFNQYSIDSFNIKLGKGQLSTNYKEIGKGQYTATLIDNHNISLDFKPGLNLTEFDLESNNLLYEIPIAGAGQYDATIKLYDAEEMGSISNIFTPGQTNFEIKVPKDWHGKMVTKARWRYDDTAPSWHDCIIDSVESASNYVLIKSNPDETLSINGDVIIDIEKVEPINPENAFENESWADLGYWVDRVFVRPFTPDADKESKLKEIYGLDKNDTFVGKHKTIEWGDVERFHGASKHDVVVASTFQANTVAKGKENNLILYEGDYDTVHHAAFTFQFNNLLTGLVSTESESHYGPIKKKFDANKVADWNTNCWVENATRSGFESSDLRKFLNGNDGDDFLAQLKGDSANIKDFIKPIASCHFTESDFLEDMRGSQRFICDRVFIPTARQMNCIPRWVPVDSENYSKEEHEWYSEDQNLGDPVFQIYMYNPQTDGACEYRQFKVSPTWGGEPIACWLATPINDAPLIDDANTLVIKTDGSIDDYDKSSKRGVLPCFCL